MLNEYKNKLDINSVTSNKRIKKIKCSQSYTHKQYNRVGGPNELPLNS